MKPEGHIVLHEPGKSYFSNVVAAFSVVLISIGLISGWVLITVLGGALLICWTAYRLKLLRDGKRDEAKAVAENRRCSVCGGLLRFRVYGLYPPDGGHASCIGYYCYACKEFDKAADDEIYRGRPKGRT